jgi:hypothetical protein
MNWITVVALGVLIAAVLVIAAGLIFGCVTNYTKRIDPAEHEHGEHAEHPHR